MKSEHNDNGSDASAEPKNSILSCSGVTKGYNEGPQPVDVLSCIDVEIFPAQHIAIVGASGSGKSTLLNVLGGLDQPDAGEVRVNGSAFSSLNENERGRVRNRSLGFVYQFHHLLPEFTALENVCMPLWIAGKKRRETAEIGQHLLAQVGLSARAEHKPAELSGGERQRVAIARALANNPACVLMDEPTGNLDTGNAHAIQQLMQSLSETMSTSFVVVTHDNALADTMDTVYELTAGRLHQREDSRAAVAGSQGQSF